MDSYERLQWEYDEGRITPEEYDKKMSKLNKLSKKRYKSFEIVNSTIVKDPDFCKKFASPFVLYLYLRTLIIRSGPLKHRTYDRNALVAMVSEDKLAAQFGVADRTIRRWISHLVENGLIKKSKLKQWGKGTDFQPNLYQLGYINKNGREDYFIDKGYF